MMIQIITLIGGYTIVKYLYINLKSSFLICKSILIEFFIKKNQKTLRERYGEWAVITGATEGIGKEYARQLAKQNINIILISKTKEKLINVANEIENEFGVKVKWITADFGGIRNTYVRIKNELNDIPVGILVNNVGIIDNHPQLFIKQSDELTNQIIDINIYATTMMSKIVLEGMKQRKRGAIVNISSSFHDVPLPYLATYSASKAYIKFFTTSLQFEYKFYKDITIQLLGPGFVDTKVGNFIDNTKMRRLMLFEKEEEFVRQALFTLGKTENSTGCFKHGIMVSFLNLFPIGLHSYFVYKTNRSLIKDIKSKNLLMPNQN